MPVIIEKVKPQDVDDLENIEKESFSTEAYSRVQLQYLLEASNAVKLKAMGDGEILGFVVGTIESHGSMSYGHIVTIDVAAKVRRRGIGLRLLEELEREFRERNVKAIYLEVRADNKPALELYKKKGYSKLEFLENYYSKGRSGLRMKKDL